ncbi:MAG: hypothetical protein E7092_02830 [Bacteroidales bacterium]|nr:hypothetical protein [Bacteroidales bacterium]
MKHFLLTAIVAFAGLVASAQSSTWPITLTTANGLPGALEVIDDYEGDTVITFVSDLYKFDEPITKLRVTVVSTNTVDAQSYGTTGTTGGNGPGFPFFCISELRILKANNKGTNFEATSNAASLNSGAYMEYINDGIYDTYFSTTTYMGDCPQAYHYIEFEFEEPMSEFRLKWHSRVNNYENMPTHIGLTPGTEYLPYPEQEFVLGEKVASADELAQGGVYVLEGHAPEYLHSFTGTKRTYPGGGFWHSPYGSHVTPNAASAIYLIPVDVQEDIYKVVWLNNKRYMKNSGAGETYHWTDSEADAAFVKFAPCDSVSGDFILTISDTLLLGHDAMGRMVLVEHKADKMGKRGRPTAWNFTLHKVELNASAIGFVLQDVIDEAERRIERLGFHDDEDCGCSYTEFAAEIERGKNLLKKSDVTSAEIINAKNKLTGYLMEYAAGEIYTYSDSVDGILQAKEDGEIKTSAAPDWVIGTYPINFLNALLATSDNALADIEEVGCMEDVDNIIDGVKAATDKFWAGRIDEFATFPIRIDESDGLPGVVQENTGYVWESPYYLFEKEVTAFRFTVFETNTGNKFGNYDSYALGEFQVYDISGNLIELTPDNFKTNSIAPLYGAGIKGLCDGSFTTYFNSAVREEQDPGGYTGTEGYPYIEVTLPTPVSAFCYKQYGRYYGFNPIDTPVKFAIGAAGVDVTPDGTSIGSVAADGDEPVSVTYYNVAGASSVTPFRNTVNIVKTVYANGKVDTYKRVMK